MKFCEWLDDDSRRIYDDHISSIYSIYMVAEKYRQTSSSDDGNNPNRMLSRPESDEDSDIEGHWWGN